MWCLLRKVSFILWLISWFLLANISHAAPNYPLIWNVQNSNEYYVGRKALLSDLHKNLIKGEREIVIVGSAGIGKTQLAKKYAETFKNKYDIVWWFNVGKNLEDQYVELAIEWNRTHKDIQFINTKLPQQEVIKQLKECLRTSESSWLLVFDNVADKNQIMNYIPNKHNRSLGHILITSKNPFTWSNIMKLEKLKRTESIELLQKITGEKDGRNANLLAEILTDYPLAIVQAASYIKSHPGMNMQEYTKLFTSSREKLWEEDKNNVKHAAFNNYEFTILTSLSLIINEIKKESKQAVDLLVFCSYLSNKYIPELLLKHYALDILKLDEISFRSNLSILGKYSLINQNISKDSKNTGNAVTYTMHELTQLSVQDTLSKQKKKEYLEKGLNITAHFLTDKFDIFLPKLLDLTYLILNMESIAEHAVSMGIDNNDLIALEQRIFEYYFIGKRDYNYAQKIMVRIEPLIQQNSQIHPILKARFAMMKSSFLAFQNIDIQESLKQIHYASEILKEIPELRDEHLMVSTKLAQTYHMLGDNQKALTYAKQGQEMIKKNNDLGTQDVFFQTLARIHTDLGDFKTALENSEKGISKAVTNDNNLFAGIIPIYVTKPIVLVKMANYKEAYPLLKTLYDASETVFGKNDHSYKAVIFCYYAFVLFKLKNESVKAKKLLKEGQEIFIRVTGKGSNKNKNLAISHMFLGEIYENEGDNVKAQFEYTKALEIFINNYNGRKATDYFSDLYTKLAIINAKLKDTASAQEYLDLHRKVFGRNHHRTTQIVEYFLNKKLSVGF